MNYILFMLKKTIFNRSNKVVLVILVALVGTILFFNVSAQKKLGYVEQLNSQLLEKQQILHNFEEELAQTEKGEHYDIIERNIALMNFLIAEDEAHLQDYQQGDLQTAYTRQLNRIQLDEKIMSENPSYYDDNLKKAIDTKRKLFTYLKDKNLPKDSEKPVLGIHFMMEYWLYVLPITVTFLSIYLLVNLYTDKFKDNIDISLLYPYRKLSLAVQDILLGNGVTTSLFLITLLLSFSLATLFSGMGSFDYPFQIINAMGDTDFVAMSVIFFKAFIIQLLSFSTCVMFVYLLSNIIKHKSATLLVAFLMILGPMIATNVVVPLQQVAHYNPFVYLNAIGIVSGEFGHTIHNDNLTFSFAVPILLIYHAIFFAIIYIKHQFPLSFKQ